MISLGALDDVCRVEVQLDILMIIVWESVLGRNTLPDRTIESKDSLDAPFDTPGRTLGRCRVDDGRWMRDLHAKHQLFDLARKQDLETYLCVPKKYFSHSHSRVSLRSGLEHHGAAGEVESWMSTTMSDAPVRRFTQPSSPIAKKELACRLLVSNLSSPL